MSTIIAPNDANIVYSPQTWDITSARAMTINVGAYLRVLLNAAPSDLAATFDLTSTTSRYSVISYRINNGPWTRARIAASVSLPLPATTTWPKTEIEILFEGHGEGVATWTTQSTAAKFTGLTTAATVLTLATYQAPTWDLDLGDSLLQGILSLTATTGQQNVDPYTNVEARFGWGYLLSRALGVEACISSWGGTGYTVAGDDSVPAFITTWNQLWSGKSRSFTTPPGRVIIQGGTNDSASTDAVVTAAVTTLLNAILSVTPPSTQIYLVRNWNGIKAAAVQSGIAPCSSPGRVSYIDTTGWWSSADSSDGTHPYGYSNVETLVPKLAAAISAKSTSGGYKRWNGTAFV